jgi:DNA replication protein DnaC
MSDRTDIPERIGRHVYTNLKNMQRLKPDSLTEEELAAISDYEEGVKPTEEQKAKRAEYAQKVFADPKEASYEFDKDMLWQLFTGTWKEQNELGFEVTNETIENLKPVMYYFLRDEKFFDCERLTDKSKPSFDKGLLIMGGYGNGKSSIMLALHTVLQFHSELSFAHRDANDVVSDYEQCKDAQEKEMLWKPLTIGRCFFDDVKTEEVANNFGKKNLFKDILEIRYKNKALTHICCNYADGQNGNIQAGLDEFGVKYGGRVYDRLKHMFNIIEFKGKSMRE